MCYMDIIQIIDLNQFGTLNLLGSLNEGSKASLQMRTNELTNISFVFALN